MAEEENSSKSVRQLAESAKQKLIPEKSKSVYLTSYDNFSTWLKNNCASITEETLMAYFEHLSETKASSTLWSTYSMIKKMILQNHEIDISKYVNLINYLKIGNKNFQSKKAKTLTPEQIHKFLFEAPDLKHLATKVSCNFITMFTNYKL